MDLNPEVCHSLILGPGLYNSVADLGVYYGPQPSSPSFPNPKARPAQPRYRSRCTLWTSAPNTATVTSYFTALMYYALISEQAHVYPYFQSKYNRRKGLDFEEKTHKNTQCF